MNSTRRKPRDAPDEAPRNVLVIGGNHLGRAVAEYLTEGTRSVTFVSEDHPIDVDAGVTSIHRKLSDAKDVRALASEVTDVDLVVIVGTDSQALLLGYLARRAFDPDAVVAALSNPATDSAFEGTGVDRIDMPRLLADQLRDRYT